ncbi:hypothetical protein [Paenibacillus sp. GCM10027626]|uniref:hypothetical protein n=1 Tax=Paenibacillus sp. GCM10027626 TaxID=3273411 RepID=UPI00363A3321
MSQQEMETAASAAGYTKAQLTSSARYAEWRDLLAALLEEDKLYSEQQALQIIDGYMKRKVK